MQLIDSEADLVMGFENKFTEIKLIADDPN